MSEFDDSWWQASQGALPEQTAAQRQSYQKAWRAMLESQAAARQQAWRTWRGMVPGQGQAPAAWAIAAPGQNVAMPNPLLSRADVPTLAQADPGNALAGYFMGQGDADPLMMHQLLGGQPGLSNV